MKKVLIVDDEFLVRLGLKTTIDWESHGYIIAGEASNGKEALELFDKINPDILLTDIKMPVMDGFKLIEEVRKKNKKIQIVILSHYDEFSYAQKALRYGATQYILKSEMNEANLIDLLKNLSDGSPDETKPGNSAEIHQKAYLKEQLLGRPADDDFKPSSLTAPQRGLFQEIEYRMLKGFCETSTLPEDSGDMLSKTIKTILENTFSQSCNLPVPYRNQFYFTSIIPLTQGKSHESIMDGAYQIIRNIKQYFDVIVQIGISEPGKPQRFPEMIYESEEARKRCFFTQKSITLFSQVIPVEEEDVNISHSKLSFFIDSGNREQLKGYIQEIFQRLKGMGSYLVFKNAFIDFLSIAKSICENHQLGQVPSLSMTKFSYDNAQAMPYIDTAENYIQDLYAAIAEAKASHEPAFSATVRNCIAYIRNNYAKNISLTDVANAAEISSSYLSLIFKQETGVNFSNYLTEYRVEQAKRMLSTTNKKIYEIADEVGFSSPYYFSKVFKEITGHTCKEYKDKYSQTYS